MDGRLRTFLAFVPEGEGPFPLLLALHGGGGNADNMRDKTHLDEAAAEAGVVVIYPDGTPSFRQGDLRTWNAAHCCGRARTDDTDDVAFLDRLIDLVVGTASIETDSIAVTGHSNGAMMAYRFGAERSEVVCCIMPVAGAIGGSTPPDAPEQRIPTPASPVDVLIFHSVDDARVPYEGGQGDNLGEQRHDLSVAEAVAFWEAAGSTVELVTTQGGHGWPGGTPDLTPAPAEPDASAMIVDWLAAAPHGGSDDAQS